MADTKELLRDQGIVAICSEIKEDNVRKAVEDILYLNNRPISIENPRIDSIKLILTSAGGHCWDGFTLVDIIEYSKIPVSTIGLGVCASMALLILCAGEKGKRIITKNTSLLSHQYSWTNSGKYHELIADRKEQELAHERFVKHYMRHTNLKRKQVEKILLPKSDVWLTGKEAKKYGLIDKIIN
jgi:ATP-dependent Clp protease protease subunit